MNTASPGDPGEEVFGRARDHFIAGNAALQAGDLQEAERCYRASLALVPQRPSTCTNLAKLLLAQDRASEAVELLQPLAAQSLEDAAVWEGLAQAFEALGDPVKALPALERACALAPSVASLHLRRGLSLDRLRRFDEALAAWARAIECDPQLAQAWANRGSLLAEMGQPVHALEHLEQALRLGGDATMLEFQIAGIRSHLPPAEAPVKASSEPAPSGDAAQQEGKSTVPAQPPRDYVRGLFDGYAADFNAHLAGRLQYQAPQVLAAGLLRQGRGFFRRALDLGCGTGLCAPPLGPLVAFIDGVDLSPQMLAQARRTERYAQLHESDLVEHLNATAQRYDLVISADVFIYVGAVDAVFQGVRRVMDAGGVFCFSVEQADDAHDFVLQPSLRYAHSARHLRELAAAHGFEVLALEPHPLRNDARFDIRGLYAWMKAGGS